MSREALRQWRSDLGGECVMSPATAQHERIVVPGQRPEMRYFVLQRCGLRCNNFPLACGESWAKSSHLCQCPFPLLLYITALAYGLRERERERERKELEGGLSSLLTCSSDSEQLLSASLLCPCKPQAVLTHTAKAFRAGSPGSSKRAHLPTCAGTRLFFRLLSVSALAN